MIVLIEGPDGAGKTILAKKLVDRFGLEYRHEGPPPKHVEPLYHYGTLLDSFRGRNVVFDRFALGERVYGPVLRGKDRLGVLGWQIFQRLVKATGAFQVLCLTDYETCEAIWSSGRPELFKDVKKFRASYELFVDLEDTQDFVYDFQLTSDDELFEYLSLPRKTLPAGMVGSPKARVLFVGDRGADPTAPFDLPFFATVNSSAYLSTAIAMAGLEEDEIAFINAYNHRRDPYRLPQLPVVVALGETAAGECESQGLKFKRVPHPQYWRRFHHHDLLGYAGKIKEACS